MAQKDEESIIQKINDFSDPQSENEEEKITNINEIHEIKENRIICGNKKIKDSAIIHDKSTNSKTKSKINKKLRIDNIRIEAFITPMLLLKEFFKLHFNLDFSSFKCTEVFGHSIGYMIQILDLYIYQLFCFYSENRGKIIDVYYTKMGKNKKILFCYFMTLTYREIYKRFISGDNKFPLFKGGTLTISLFPTIEKAKKEKRQKLIAKGESTDYINNKINIYEKLCKDMINDIDNNKLVRGSKKEISFNIDEIVELTKEKAYFEEIAKSNGIELDEE